MSQLSIKLPLRETAQVTSIKLPLRETAWVLSGFVLIENIIDWKEKTFNILESIKSRLYFDVELIDKNHIKIKWYGEPVPQVSIFKKYEYDDEFPTKPVTTLNWSVGEYEMLVDGNGYDIKIIGKDNTGISDQVSIGANQDNDIDVTLKLPVNEKYYYFDIDLTSIYRIEVNL